MTRNTPYLHFVYLYGLLNFVSVDRAYPAESTIGPSTRSSKSLAGKSLVEDLGFISPAFKDLGTRIDRAGQQGDVIALASLAVQVAFLEGLSISEISESKANHILESACAILLEQSDSLVNLQDLMAVLRAYVLLGRPSLSNEASNFGSEIKSDFYSEFSSTTQTGIENQIRPDLNEEKPQLAEGENRVRAATRTRPVSRAPSASVRSIQKQVQVNRPRSNPIPKTTRLKPGASGVRGSNDSLPVMDQADIDSENGFGRKIKNLKGGWKQDQSLEDSFNKLKEYFGKSNQSIAPTDVFLPSDNESIHNEKPTKELKD
jgi:hypothetical protein